MVCIVCTNPKTPDKSGFKLHTMAKNGVQDSVHGVQGSVHERRNAQIGIACQAHAASLLYIHPHPTAARRAATLASSEREMHMGARTSSDRFRGVLRHEKKPEWYTSTPTGLKRLKTQITASYFSVSSSPMSPKCLNASRIASRFSGGHFGCFLSPDLSACVSSPHSAFICATYRELTFMPCVF